MKAAWSLVITFLTIFIAYPANRKETLVSVPQVKITAPDEKGSYSWGQQVTYAISVVDSKDGDSKYGEIPSNECSLSVTYLPGNKATDIKQIIEQKEDPGLLLIK